VLIFARDRIKKRNLMAMCWLSPISHNLASTDDLTDGEEPEDFGSSNTNESHFLAIHVSYSSQEFLWSSSVLAEQ